ncbi:MAG TPA: sugar phosphate nucleotidyltransferase [bacterium]|nr:sugar phosphate nucleotidyltransferase [bacterium]
MGKKLAVLILAAGKGKRLGGQSQKVVRTLLGKPLLLYLLETIDSLHPQRIVLIVGYKKEEVFAQLKERKVEYAEQNLPKGTGHAVMQASSILKEYSGDILILCGDVPFITISTLRKLLEKHKKSGNCGTILTVVMENPFGYGRIKRNGKGSVKSIIEEINATGEEKEIKEINAGIYVFDKMELFKALNDVVPDKVKGELYLTDVVEILSSSGKKIDTHTTDKPEECLGINTLEDMIKAETFLKKEKMNE